MLCTEILGSETKSGCSYIHDHGSGCVAFSADAAWSGLEKHAAALQIQSPISTQRKQGETLCVHIQKQKKKLAKVVRQGKTFGAKHTASGEATSSFEAWWGFVDVQGVNCDC